MSDLVRIAPLWYCICAKSVQPDIASLSILYGGGFCAHI